MVKWKEETNEGNWDKREKEDLFEKERHNRMRIFVGFGLWIERLFLGF